MVAHLIPEGGGLTPEHKVYAFPFRLFQERVLNEFLSSQQRTCIGSQRDAECKEDEGSAGSPFLDELVCNQLLSRSFELFMSRPCRRGSRGRGLVVLLIVCVRAVVWVD